MNKTIYIRDEDVAVWDRAKQLAGDKLAPIIVDGLRRFIVEKEGETMKMKGFERIELTFPDGNRHGIPKRIAFSGKWIYSPEKALRSEDAMGTAVERVAIAETAKGAFAFFYWTELPEFESWRQLTVYPSLEAAAADKRFNWAVLAAIEERGVPVEELDI